MKGNYIKTILQSRKNYAADHDTDDDLNTGIDIPFCSFVVNGDLCGDGCVVCFLLEVLKKLFHDVVFLSVFELFCFL